MLRKRIIFTLLYDSGFFTQSRNFRLQKVGNLNWLENNYQFQKIAFSLDELIVINASRININMIDFAQMVSRLVNDVFIPITNATVTKYSFTIYNRWGIKVFETNNYNTLWDGKYLEQDCDMDTYFFIMIFF